MTTNIDLRDEPHRGGRMSFAEFHNGLRILLNIDRPELEAAGVIKVNDHNAWGTFTRDPFRWFIRADDETAAKLWAIVQRKQRP